MIEICIEYKSYFEFWILIFSLASIAVQFFLVVLGSCKVQLPVSHETMREDDSHSTGQCIAKLCCSIGKVSYVHF